MSCAALLAIGCGYPDGNDFDRLRFDPAFKPALPDGSYDSGGDLCSAADHFALGECADATRAGSLSTPFPTQVQRFAPHLYITFQTGWNKEFGLGTAKHKNPPSPANGMICSGRSVSTGPSTIMPSSSWP